MLLHCAHASTSLTNIFEPSKRTVKQQQHADLAQCLHLSKNNEVDEHIANIYTSPKGIPSNTLYAIIVGQCVKFCIRKEHYVALCSQRARKKVWLVSHRNDVDDNPLHARHQTGSVRANGMGANYAQSSCGIKENDKIHVLLGERVNAQPSCLGSGACSHFFL